jgi:hypothetical protein
MFHVLWFQEKEPRYAFSFSLKSPNKQTPCRLFNRAVMERAAHLQGLFYLPLKFLIKIALNKDFFSPFPRP